MTWRDDWPAASRIRPARPRWPVPRRPERARGGRRPGGVGHPAEGHRRRAGPSRDKKEEAAARVALAAQLADSADQPDDDQAGTSRPVPSAVAEARTRAAQALDVLGARASKVEPKSPAPPTDPHPGTDPDLALKPGQLDTARPGPPRAATPRAIPGRSAATSSRSRRYAPNRSRSAAR